MANGNVNIGHIDSGSEPAGNVATTDGSGGATWETPTGGGGGGAEVDGLAAFYTIGTRVLAVQVQQDNGVDFTGTATFPITSNVRYGLAETSTDAEAADASSDAVVLTPGNLPSVDLSDLNESERLCGDLDTDPTAVTGRLCAINAAGDTLEYVYRGEIFWTATATYTQATDTLALTVLTDQAGVTGSPDANDRIQFVAPSNLGSDNSDLNLTVNTTTGGELTDNEGTRLSAADLVASSVYHGFYNSAANDLHLFRTQGSGGAGLSRPAIRQT